MRGHPHRWLELRTQTKTSPAAQQLAPARPGPVGSVRRDLQLLPALAAAPEAQLPAWAEPKL